VPHTKLHDAIADSVALAEAAVERTINGRSDRIVTLLREPSERDPEIWKRAFKAAADAGGPLTADDWDVDMDDLELWPKEARVFQWAAIVQMSLATAAAQYDAESVLRPLWAALQKGGLAVMAAASGVPRPLSPEAKRGPGRARFAAAKERANAEKP
jgi:hypothetical protein